MAGNAFKNIGFKIGSNRNFRTKVHVLTIKEFIITGYL